MFFYVSFLRPPPKEISPSGTIIITPQIANDLRTEPFPDELDIYYVWLLEPLPNPLLISTLSTVPVPKKLTRWRPTNMYKEITLPLPEHATVGQCWRLVLTTRSPSRCESFTTGLDGEDIGTSPFAVMSMPIKMVEHLQMSPSRQNQIHRFFRFSAGQHVMAIKEELSYDLDKKIWDSGVGLSSWLVDLKNGVLRANDSEAITAVHDALYSPEKRRIIELGTGSGIVSVTLSALRASLGISHQDSILATDLPSAMPLLEDNINANNHLYELSPPRAAVLDWDQHDLPEVVIQNGGYRVIIMSDVSYNTSSFPSLLRTITRLFDLQPRDAKPVLLIGYKKRDSSERQLWEHMVKDLGITFEKVGNRKGAGGASVSLWVGRLF